jgi:hypothetical protein
MTDTALHRQLAVAAHGECWALLEKPQRTEADEDAMVHAAHASLYHWMRAGTAVHLQRGNWLIARAYVALALPAPARRFARRTLELTAGHASELEDFDLAFAEEIAARAEALAGDMPAAAGHLARARRLGGEIEDGEDRRVFFEQLEAGPWFGLGGERPPNGDDR